MGKTQKIITTSLWGLVVLGMLAFIATRSMRGQSNHEPAPAPAAESLYDVPAFTLIDQNGNPLSNKDLLGKVWIADFIFTNCAGPCPGMTAKMAELQKQMGSPDVKLISFSVDPERDTPAALKDYARQYQADESRWSLLTGTPKQMAEVARGMNMAAQKEADQSVTHSTQFLMVDREGHVRRIYRMSDPDVLKRLAEDAGKLADARR